MSGIDSDSKIILHFDSDINGILIDSSTYSHSASLVADVVLDTSSPKFGVSALRSVLNTEGYGWAAVSFVSDMSLSSSFTVDFWFKAPSTPAGRVCFWSTSGGGYRFSVYNNTLVILGCATFPDFSAYMDNAWHHVALVVDIVVGADPRDELNTVYVDGVLFCSIPCTTTYWAFAPKTTWHIGELSGSEDFKTDEFRFSSCIRYTENFVPSTEAYSITEPVPYYITVNDDIVLLDDPFDFAAILSDTLFLSGLSIVEKMAYLISVIDSLTTVDSISYSLLLLTIVQDEIDLSDTATARLGLLLCEYLSSMDSVAVNWLGDSSVASTLGVSDSITSELYLSLSDVATLTDTTTMELCISILEQLGFAELVAAIGRLNHSVSDTLSVADSVYPGFTEAISEVLSLVDVASVVRLLLNSISDSLDASDSTSGQLNSVFPVTDSLSISDTVASQGLLFNVIYDALVLNLNIELDGETWECYVLNTPKFMPSIYSGFNFNSYAVFENRAYGCKDDGIYELTGDTDNGVVFHTGVQMSETKFGIPNQKRFRKAYVGVSGAKPMMVMEAEDGKSKAYRIDSDGEVDASRALKSKKWKLAVVDFEQLDFVKLIPVVLAK